jgi:hypothetical protein
VKIFKIVWCVGGMLVVSVSVCGLVTLAAMTQPSLAPEAKHSLLQYVTGKYLHPPSCRVSYTKQTWKMKVVRDFRLF